MNDLRGVWFSGWKHHVVQVVALVPNSKLSPESIPTGDGGVMLWRWRRERGQPFKRSSSFLVKKRLAPIRLIIEGLHSDYRQFLGLGRPAMRLPTRAGEPGNSPIRYRLLPLSAPSCCFV